VSDEKQFDAKKFSGDLRDRIHREVHESVHAFSQNPEGKRKHIIGGVYLGNFAGGGIFWGALLTLVGLALLLDHMGYVSITHLWRFWPLLLVAAGVLNFSSRQQRAWGVFLIAVGTVLQLNELGIVHLTWADFWPIVLIGIGLLIMWGSLQARRRPSAASGGGDPRTTVNGVAIFSGLERRVTTQDFQGGNVSAVFGGIELDLSEANMQADEATLEVNAVFGGAEIRVPDTWVVSYRGSPLFGGVEDRTRIRRTEEPADPKRKILILTGAVVFGGLEIKN
jgi:predicted membrane protein